MNVELPAEFLSQILDWEPVGSRVTCSPAPTDTDQDVLVLIHPDKIYQVFGWLSGNGWSLDGSDPGNFDDIGVESRFQSFSRGEINLICTSSEVFYNRFIAATAVAKHLNLMKKADRLILFQAVLYGNDAVEDMAEIEENQRTVNEMFGPTPAEDPGALA